MVDRKLKPLIHQSSGMQHKAQSVVTLVKILLFYELTVETLVHLEKNRLFNCPVFNRNCQPDIPLKNWTVRSKTGRGNPNGR